MKHFRITLFILLGFMLSSLPMSGQLTEEELAKIAQNPLANIISVPLQNNTTFGVGPFDRTQNITNFQPVIPYLDGKVIVRAIVPIVNQPNVFSETGNIKGVGNVSLSVFYASNKGKVNWGIGPVLNFPAGNDLGLNEWGMGPSFVAVVKPGNWVIGTLVSNAWSFESDASGFTLQPFINYNLPKGYYLSSSPKITANWQASSGNKWTVPMGIAFGKLLKPKGFLPLNMQAGAYYNVAKPELVGGDWTLRLGITVLVPKALFNKKKTG
ncbi:hypothetical protein [Flagellimonas sp.]|uniref:hypothetical protein n=1 Tax=Flagellimonas sp. TaxID=2058762 RepID=UPI003B506880